jgi:hypothetical protein
VRAPRGDGADRDTAHQPPLGDEVGAHLARADDADPDRTALVGAARKVAGKSGQDDIGHSIFGHRFSGDL